MVAGINLERWAFRVCNPTYRKEVKSTMVRIGRVVFDENNVSSVMRENGTGNPVKVTVNMKQGESHEFNKYAKEAWEYFKSRVSRTIAG